MAFHKLGGIWHTMDLLGDLDKIRVPTLVLAGEDDPITPLQDSIDIAERLSDDILRFAPFSQAGHGVWRDRPDETFALLRDFITA